MQTTNNDAGVILEAGRQLAGPQELANGATFAVLGEGQRVHDLEKMLDHPVRARSSVRVEDAESFISYFNRFKRAESVIFASIGGPDAREFVIRGVFDYHQSSETEAAKAGHAEHSVIYRPPQSEEWARWKSKTGVRMSQTDFALFIEENSLDIVEPSAANMIEVSRSLRAKKNVEFVSDQRLSDGSVQFAYNEEVQGTAGKGNMKVPETFVVGAPVFFNGPRYKLKALLRYRIDGGRLWIWYDLHRVEYAEQDAFNEIVSMVEEKVAGAPVFRGTL